MAKNNNTTEIFYPITFNPHKHHLGFLQNQLIIWQNQECHIVNNELLCIGNNLIDLYYGRLSVDDILNESHKFFKKTGISNSGKLEQWLHPFEYRKIILSDKSLWIIKKGTDSKRFIHIHPAKNSPFSVRVRATTLKTVIALKIQSDIDKEDTIHLDTVNRIRTTYLGLSPIKNLERGKGISRLWNIFGYSE
jgi:hypothetical protein